MNFKKVLGISIFILILSVSNSSSGFADEIDELNATSTELCTIVQANGLMKAVLKSSGLDLVDAARLGLQRASDIGGMARASLGMCQERQALSADQLGVGDVSDEAQKREIRDRIGISAHALTRLIDQVLREDQRLAENVKGDLKDRIFQVGESPDIAALSGASKAKMSFILGLAKSLRDCEGENETNRSNDK